MLHHPAQAEELPAREARQGVANGGPFDWAYGEALAMGSLLLEAFPCASADRMPAAAPSASATPISTTRKRAALLPAQARRPGPGAGVHLQFAAQEAGVLGFDYGTR